MVAFPTRPKNGSAFRVPRKRRESRKHVRCETRFRSRILPHGIGTCRRVELVCRGEGREAQVHESDRSICVRVRQPHSPLQFTPRLSLDCICFLVWLLALYPLQRIQMRSLCEGSGDAGLTAVSTSSTVTRSRTPIVDPSMRCSHADAMQTSIDRHHPMLYPIFPVSSIVATSGTSAQAHSRVCEL